jgi:hypothetical protein
MKYLSWLSLAALFIIAQIWFMGGFKAEQDDYIASSWIKERHKYYGISGSVIEKGKHYFYREGKRCAL